MQIDSFFKQLATAIARIRCIELMQIRTVFCSSPDFLAAAKDFVPWAEVALPLEASQEYVIVHSKGCSRLTTLEDFFSCYKLAVDLVICSAEDENELFQKLSRTSIVIVVFSPKELRERNSTLCGFTQIASHDCGVFGFKVFTRKQPLFDVVIPVGPKDSESLAITAAAVRENVIGHRNLYTVSKSRDKVGNAWLDERNYRIDVDGISALGIPRARAGWYLQQLLKLDFRTVEPRVTNNYLVLDADTTFKRPTEFIDVEGRYLLTVATEFHAPYFEHMRQLIPWLNRVTRHSGVSHHMFFSEVILSKLIQLVQRYTDEDWATAFLKCVDPRYYGAGASEYELYFNFAVSLFPDRVRLRELHWNDQYNDVRKNLNSTQCLDFYSNHWHIRQST